MQSFSLPTDDLDLVLFMEAFYVRLLRYADILDIKQCTLHTLHADSVALRQGVFRLQKLTREVAAVGRQRNMLMGTSNTRTVEVHNASRVPTREGLLERAHCLIAQITAHPDFTPAIGEELGLTHLTASPSSPTAIIFSIGRQVRSTSF
jgi:hypothetical protein